MASNAQGGKARSQKDKEMASRMKREGVVRTTGRCAVCYRIITCDSSISRYKHICDGYYKKN